jgi:hypothetical protein
MQLYEPVEGEIWKPIPGFSRYEVSNLGRVKSLRASVHKLPIILKMCKSPKGRGVPSVMLYDEDGVFRKRVSVSRLVAIAFIPNPDKLNYVIPIDGDMWNCHYSNLKWDNCHTGENNPNAKLTNNQVRRIRKLAKDGVKLKDIAIIYEMSVGAINDIVIGRNFKNIDKVAVKKDRHTKLNVVKAKRRKLVSWVGQCKQ